MMGLKSALSLLYTKFSENAYKVQMNVLVVFDILNQLYFLHCDLVLYNFLF